MALILVLLVLFPLTHASSSCGTTDRDLISLAFSSVAAFQPTLLNSTGASGCAAAVREIRLPSRNLTGTVSWMVLRNISTLRALDLSGNALEGSVPGRFWSAPALAEVNLAGNHLGGALRFEPGSSQAALRELNLSGNRFTSATGIEGFVGIQVLDLSGNGLGVVPPGLEKLCGLRYLDLSHNSMVGEFPKDFPPLGGLTHLNISYNKFTGRVESEVVAKFGRSAFAKAGSLSFSNSTPASRLPTAVAHEKTHKATNKRSRLWTALIAGGCALVGFVLFVVIVLVWMKRRKKRRKRWVGERKVEEAVGMAQQEGGWVAEARWSAPVVVFEKPLMEVTFSDLVAATSGFGRESQLAEGGGRSGPAYCAVLPGDMHVVVRVLERARDVEESDAATAFRELARLRHPNLLPLLGYCIPGKEKLLLYEYMGRGDLHRWLHELPAGNPTLDDFTGDTWEHNHGEGQGTSAAAAAGDWPTRHRILVGIARGLAFLHQGWAGSGRPVVHGHLVPSNILLSEDLEPRIADFSMGGEGSGATAEGDVYDYGIMVMEMVTGREGRSKTEVERIRGIVRAGRVVDVVDPGLIDGGVGGGAAAAATVVREVADCLRVGLLCTAQESFKRPTMQQVVGLLKDVRPTAFS